MISQLRSAIQKWQLAQNAQQFIVENKENYNIAKQFVAEQKIKQNAMAYYLGYVLEMIFLATPVISFFDFTDNNGPIWYAAIFVIVGTLMIIMNALIGQAVLFKFNGKWVLYKAVLENSNSSIIDLPTTMDETNQQQLRSESNSLFFLLILMTSLLAGARAMVLVTNNESANAYMTFIGSFLLAFAMMSVFFSTHAATRIWKDFKNKRKNFLQAVNNRKKALNNYALEAEKFLKNTPDTNNIVGNTYTEKEQLVVDAYYSMITNRNDFGYLLPLQQLTIKVYYAKEAAIGVQVVAYTKSETTLTLITDKNGEVTLKWNAFDPILKLVYVGNKRLKNVITSEEKLEVELTQFSVVNPQLNRRTS